MRPIKAETAKKVGPMVNHDVGLAVRGLLDARRHAGVHQVESISGNWVRGSNGGEPRFYIAVKSTQRFEVDLHEDFGPN